MGMQGNVVIASILQGTHKTLTILYILFGALVLLNTLRQTGAVNRINAGFKNFTRYACPSNYCRFLIWFTY